MKMLICDHISKQYEKGKYALRDVNFSIPAKGIFALIGRNGAGKTTLIRILSTQLLPTSGSAAIDGIDVVEQEGKLRDIIACVPQEARAVGWVTPKQFIVSYLMWRGFSIKEATHRMNEAMKKLGIQRYMDSPNRILSGGTKRKVLVAMAMSSEARVLFLDEPTTGLDPISRDELWKTLMKLKKDHFIFLTTHYLEEAEKLADKIGILEGGKIMALGTMEELRKKVKYPYSIKILSKTRMIKPKSGDIIKGVDGQYQIVTTESEANRLSKELIGKKVRFSMNPLVLDDIFYYIVKKPIEEERYEDEEKSY
ncbi:MAG: ABC transporter ATP-binding protein [Candidatus Micrarchaeaceae archaeon]